MNRRVTYVLLGVAIGGIILFATRKQIGKAIQYGLTLQQERQIKTLNPAVQNRFRELIKAIEAKGYNVIITSPYRSINKQQRLFEERKTTVPGGHSTHNYGIAIDINAQKNTKWYGLNTSKGEWEKTGIPALIRSYGFRWGGDFSAYDPVHIDLANKYNVNKLYGEAQRTGIPGNRLKLAA